MLLALLHLYTRIFFVRLIQQPLISHAQLERLFAAEAANHIVLVWPNIAACVTAEANFVPAQQRKWRLEAIVNVKFD